MRTAADCEVWFEANKGRSEEPPGSNHVPGITDWWGLGDVAWCAEGLSVMFMQVGFGSFELAVLDMPGIWTRYPWGSAYVPDWEQAFRDAGRFGQEPIYGDVPIYDWDGDRYGDHIGWYLRDLGDGTFLAWECNTSDNDISLRRRPYNLVAGFGRPPYDSTEDTMAALTDAEQRELLERVRQLSADNVFLKDVVARLVAGGGTSPDYYADAVRTHGLIEQAAIRGGAEGVVTVTGSLDFKRPG